MGGWQSLNVRTALLLVVVMPLLECSCDEAVMVQLSMLRRHACLG